MEGAPACPFVAFGDDREGRSTTPDHRHRCFAESPPAPRAVAHQEAYCLSSAFPVCPTFQDWARREAAHARRGGERPEVAPTAVASWSRGDPVDEYADESDPEALGGPASHDDQPVTRNPPRDWAAPPPWAMGAAGAGAATRPAGSSSGPPGDVAASDFRASHPPEGQGLAGSAADRLAGGDAVSAAAWSASAAGSVSTAPDDDLAGLVQGRSPRDQPARPVASEYPPPTRMGRRPAVSSTRPSGDAAPGPTWERMRRFEAYPTIKTRVGLPGVSRAVVLAGAVGIAALVLFMLPALLGIGGGSSSSAKPSGSRPPATTSLVPTAVPAPTPLVYIVKANDNLGKIAKKFGVTLEALLAANPEITNADRIKLGQKIVIPGSAPFPSAKASAKASARPATSAAP